jgi:hypothetical protein
MPNADGGYSRNFGISHSEFGIATIFSDGYGSGPDASVCLSHRPKPQAL